MALICLNDKRGNMATMQRDADRLSDRIWIEYGHEIYDQESFNMAFEKYIGQDLTIQQDVLLRDMTYEHTKEKIERIGKKERMYRKEKMNIRTSGIKKDRQNHEYAYTGKSKDKIVYAYESHMIIKGREYIRLRDRKGRFVKRI